MNDALEIEKAKQSIVAAGNLLEIDALPPDRSKIDSGDRNAIFRCEIPGGITLQGGGSLIVEGSVKGTDGNGCRISVLGDALVDGSVEHTQVNAANIRVRGTSRHSELVASDDIMLGEHLSDSRCIAGDFRERHRRVDELKRAISGVSQDRENLERQIALQERRVGRACRTTRSPLDFNVPRIIQHETERVTVDLTQFAESVGASSDDRFELALNEFFAKGIVGILVKTNSRYVSDNLSREKVFLQLLKSLRELFIAVGKRDRAQAFLERACSELDQVLETLGDRGQRISIGGEVEPGSVLKFLLPTVKRSPDGEIELEEHSASAEIGSSGSRLEAQLLSGKGEKSTQVVGKRDLIHAVFSLDGDSVRWSPIQTD